MPSPATKTLPAILSVLPVFAFLSLAPTVRAQSANVTQTTAAPTLTAESLRVELASPARDDAALARRVLDWVGGPEKAAKGAVKVDKSTPGALTVAWVYAAPGLSDANPPVVVSEDRTFAARMRRVGGAGSDQWAVALARPDGIAVRWNIEVGGERRATGGQLEEYPKNPDEIAVPGVPKGALTQMPSFRSQVFAGTGRDWWVYVPAQAAAKPDEPAVVMVFQDGGGPKNWAPAVLDNLIARGEIPPTVGIFINPAKFDDDRSNRSVEYDTLSDAYARFVIEEILPEAEKAAKVKFTTDPDRRVIYGVSSGGICAFTVAWERPDHFRKVFTVVGSFTNLQGGPTGVGGGNTYPAILRKRRGWDRKGEPKPIKLFMTDGSNDVDNAAGSWWLANLEMDRALTYGGYEHKFIGNTGFHNDLFGRFQFSHGLRWLWAKREAGKAE